MVIFSSSFRFNGCRSFNSLDNAYSVGIGDWDKVSVAYSYTEFNDFQNKTLELNKIHYLSHNVLVAAEYDHVSLIYIEFLLLSQTNVLQ